VKSRKSYMLKVPSTVQCSRPHLLSLSIRDKANVCVRTYYIRTYVILCLRRADSLSGRKDVVNRQITESPPPPDEWANIEKLLLFFSPVRSFGSFRTTLLCTTFHSRNVLCAFKMPTQEDFRLN